MLKESKIVRSLRELNQHQQKEKKRDFENTIIVSTKASLYQKHRRQKKKRYRMTIKIKMHKKRNQEKKIKQQKTI